MLVKVSLLLVVSAAVALAKKTRSVSWNGRSSQEVRFKTKENPFTGYELRFNFNKDDLKCVKPKLTVDLAKTDYDSKLEYIKFYVNGGQMRICNPGVQGQAKKRYTCFRKVEVKGVSELRYTNRLTVEAVPGSNQINSLRGKPSFDTKIRLTCSSVQREKPDVQVVNYNGKSSQVIRYQDKDPKFHGYNLDVRFLQRETFCANPRLTVKIARTDFNSRKEYVMVRLVGGASVKCDPKKANKENEYYTCMNHKLVRKERFGYNERLQLRVEPRGDINKLSNQHSFKSIVTLSCAVEKRVSKTALWNGQRTQTYQYTTSASRFGGFRLRMNFHKDNLICMQPRLTAALAMTDYDSKSEYVSLRINGRSAIKCDPGKANQASKYHRCFSKRSLGAPSYGDGNSFGVEAIPSSAGINKLGNKVSFGIKLTLTCGSVKSTIQRVKWNGRAKQVIRYRDPHTEFNNYKLRIAFDRKYRYCGKPKLTMQVAQTDFNAKNEYVTLFLGGKELKKCDPGKANKASEYFTCLNKQATRRPELGNGDELRLTALSSGQVHKLSSKQASFASIVTLQCEVHQAAVTQRWNGRAKQVFSHNNKLSTFDVYALTVAFEQRGKRCVRPQLTAQVAATDFNAAQEYVQFEVQGRSKVRCNPGVQGKEGQFYPCFNRISLARGPFVYGDKLRVRVTAPKDRVNRLKGKFSFRSKITLQCAGGVARTANVVPLHLVALIAGCALLALLFIAKLRRSDASPKTQEAAGASAEASQYGAAVV